MEYYIQGDPARADQIKATFEELGYEISWSEGCANPDVINIGVERNGAKYVVAETSEYIKDIIKTHPDYQELELPVEPKFKVGDTISTGKVHTTILQLDMDKQGYRCSDEWFVYFKNQDLWHLVPKPHYDVSNFHEGTPVLVRDGNCHEWRYVTFSHYRKVGTPFCAGGQYWYQCIPFGEGTKHLLGTTDMCPEEYINW